MAESDVRVPAGWYPDPLGLPQLRWWDNHSWTEYTSDARQPMVPQETVTQQTRLAYADDDEGDDGLTRRERREREQRDADGVTDSDGILIETAETKPAAEALLSLEAPAKEEVTLDELSPAAMFADIAPTDAPTSAAYNLDSRFDDLLGAPAGPVSAFTHVSESTTAFIPEPTAPPTAAPAATAPAAAPASATATDLSVSTGGAWAIAFMPVFVLLAGMFFLLSGMAGPLSWVFVALIIVVPYAVTVILAYFDRAQLIRKGHDHTAHWALAFAGGPIYLIARFAAVVRRSGRGFGPVVSWVGLAAVAGLAVLAVPGLIISMAPTTFSAEAESGVVRQAATLGASLQVDCPDVPPMIIGQSFQCTASRDSGAGDSWPITVSLERANGWFEFPVSDWGLFSTNFSG